jgi:tRNA(Ile2) C34 agmatinyltransferase TiaS
MSDPTFSVSRFSCPKCDAEGLWVLSRGDTPLAYHCKKCRAKFRATYDAFKLLDDENPKLIEQAVDSDDVTHDLGRVDFAD